jgi:DNA replication protein DnaC
MAARLIERGVNVLIVSAYTFLQMARKSYFDGECGVRELEEVPVLMLDDLGSEPLMQNITIEQLFQLINERQSRGLSTVISTNLTLKELRERYTERIASRLNDPQNCRIILLEGSDLRKAER